MIQVKNLHKDFEGTPALDDMCMEVQKGAIYGLVGLNGAGKTTLIKHIAGILPTQPGCVQIDGADVYENTAVKAQIGYVPDDPFFWPQYSLSSMSRFFAKLYPAYSRERFVQLADMLGLHKKRKISGFSKGMQKQAALVLALSAMPQVLLLDEPIDGLDPIVRHKVFKFIFDDVALRQMTVLISSHNLKEMDGACDTIGIIKDGRMILQRDLDEIKADHASAGAQDAPTLDEIFVAIHENPGTKTQALGGVL